MDEVGVDAFHTLLGSLYDAVTTGTGFQTFNAVLCAHFNLRSAMLIVRDARTLSAKCYWQHGSDAAWLESYAVDYSREDLLAQHMITAPIAGFYASNLDIPRPERIAGSRFFREWIAPQNIAYAAGCIVMREGDHLTEFFVQRTPQQPPFTRQEMAGLNRLVPHLQRAIQMQQRFMDLQIGQHYLGAALDKLVVPAILLNETGRIAFANASATATLKQRDYLWNDGGRLTFRHSALTHTFNVELHRAIRISQGEELELDGVVMLPRVGQPPLTLMVTPLRVPLGTRSSGAALLFMFDRQASPAVTAGIVRSLFGLTDAEAGLAVALCSGMSLDDVAGERGVSIHTTRAQLKSIFAKTGTKRQADLVSLLLTSPAYFVSSDSDA